ncbi:MAG TPA: GNAT family N-acetyltransferase [Nocardioidaceae bacterium]|nr:GNAT family N-acetyltransferase [Nocardioidaceae bacterium]
MTETVGAVVALLDAFGPFGLGPREATFPDATPDDWRRAAAIDPSAVGPDNRWDLAFRCFAIGRPDGAVTLVDAGIGPEGGLASAWAPVPGRLPAALVEAGIDGDAVDTVILTHLHEDHVGWSVRPDGEPMFPNARYVVQRNEVRDLEERRVESVLAAVVRPLRQAGQLGEIVSRRVLVSGAPRVTVWPTPGHTLGHQSVLVEGGPRDVVISGDVLVHAVQLARPEVGYAYERDSALASRTRRTLLADLERRDGVLATAHLTRPFVTRDGAVVEQAGRFASYEPSRSGARRTDVVTRPAEPSDVAACVQLAMERDGGDLAAWRSRFESYLVGDDRALFVAEVDGEFAGYGRLERLEPEAEGDTPAAPPGWYLVGVVVPPRWQRRGVGTALTRARLTWAWERADEVWYFVNARNRASIDLHREFGFVEVTRDFAIPGVQFDDGHGTGVLLRCRRGS